MDTNNNEDDCYIKNGDEDDKPREAASMNSLVIEEVTITVKNMDTTEGENGNVSMIVKLNQTNSLCYKKRENEGNHSSYNYNFELQALGTYTLVDGNTGQKLVDEKDIGNNESIRTEYDIEEVNIDAEE